MTITERAAAMLTDLIALPTVNPMGRHYEGHLPVERPVVEYLERLFSGLGVEIVRQACSPTHESLLITIPGRSDGPGTLFESHIDTVPADDWPATAFVPRTEGTRIYGRGACDDKGSLAAMVLAALQLLESGEPPPSTVLLLAAGDEEYAQTGIQHFIAGHQAAIGRAVIGEPTDVRPVVQQKGVIRWDITVHGRSAHTSQPEQGRNAILDMLRVIEELSRHEKLLQSRNHNPLMTGPTITVTMINGGRTRNAVPDECRVAVDFRTLPEMDRGPAMVELRSRLESLDIPLTHGEFQCYVPGLQTSPDDPFVFEVVRQCRSALGLEVAPAGVPYGSDACYIPSGTPTVVLGPGNISQAHTVDEFVDLGQVVQAAAVYHQLMRHRW